MIEHTDTDYAPWTSIKSNDKKRARINAMRFFLNQFEYEGKDCPILCSHPLTCRILNRRCTGMIRPWR